MNANSVDITVEIVHTSENEPAQDCENTPKCIDLTPESETIGQCEAQKSTENKPAQDCENTPKCSDLTPESETIVQCEAQKSSAVVWNHKATSLLVKTYEEKLELLESPKKKKQIWIAIANRLKDLGVDVTPDQVRWKINALTKKYKLCLNGQINKFKYFDAIDNIYAKYNVDCQTYSIQNLNILNSDTNKLPHAAESKPAKDSQALIQLRKKRLVQRIESERSQNKIHIEKQWLEYMRRQELQSQWRDNVFERSLKIKEKELEIRRQLIEVRETFDLQKIETEERDQKEIIQVEKEKLQLLKKLYLND